MKIRQYAEGLNHLYQTCLDQFKSKLPADIEHFVHDKNPFPELNKYDDLQIRSNGMRFKFLSEPGEIIWADADTLIGGKGFPDLSEWPKDKPYLSSPDGIHVNADVMISFNHSEWFKKIYDEHEATEHKTSTTYAMVLERHKGEYYFIPAGHFLAVNLNSTRNKNAVSIGSDNFAVVKDKNGEWKFSFLRGVIKP